MTREATTPPACPRERTRPQRIGLRSTGTLMTPEQYDALPTDRRVEGYRYELINGVLVVSPVPRATERSLGDHLGYLLRSHGETHPEGASLDATLPGQIVHGTTQRRYCDRAIWTGLGRMPDVEVDVSTIAVEFVSRAKRDRVRDYEVKRDEYQTAGVREYWIIDYYHRSMTVHRFEADKTSTFQIDEAGTYQTDLLPGFQLPLASLLRVTDAWKRPPRRHRPNRGG